MSVVVEETPDGWLIRYGDVEHGPGELGDVIAEAIDMARLEGAEGYEDAERRADVAAAELEITRDALLLEIARHQDHVNALLDALCNKRGGK